MVYGRGRHCLVDMERFIPTAKSTAYLNAVYAQQQARKIGAIEAVYVDRDHRVLEGTTTNIYGIKGNELITPPDNILPGVTRGWSWNWRKRCWM